MPAPIPHIPPPPPHTQNSPPPPPPPLPPHITPPPPPHTQHTLTLTARYARPPPLFCPPGSAIRWSYLLVTHNMQISWNMTSMTSGCIPQSYDRWRHNSTRQAPMCFAGMWAWWRYCQARMIGVGCSTHISWCGYTVFIYLTGGQDKTGVTTGIMTGGTWQGSDRQHTQYIFFMFILYFKLLEYFCSICLTSAQFYCQQVIDIILFWITSKSGVVVPAFVSHVPLSNVSKARKKT